MKRLTPGEVISNERKQQGMTQEQLASILNIDKRSVAKMEGGEYKSTIETIKKYTEPLGKEPVVILTDIIEDKDYPVGRSYTSYMIENITPIKNIEAVNPSVRNTSVGFQGFVKSFLDMVFRPRKARDITALIDFWRLILLSGALDAPCAGIQLSIRVEEKAKELAAVDFLDSVVSGLFIKEKTYDDIFNAEIGCSLKALVETCSIDQESGNVSIIFHNSLQQDKKIKSIIKSLVDREKEKLRKAERYYAHNPDGFHYICYDLPFEYDANDYMDSFEIVKAWTPEEAKKKYLAINQEERLFNFYENDFVNSFFDSALSGDKFENLVNAKKISEVAESLYENIECRTGNSSLERDDLGRIKDEIISDYTKEELFNVFGINDFKNYWLERAMLDVGSQLPQSEADMMEYVYSVIISRNRTSEDEVKE